MKFIFARGPSQTARLIFALFLSIALMLLDHRYHQAEKMRSILSVLTYPIILIAQIPAQIGSHLTLWWQDHAELIKNNQRLKQENLYLKAEQQRMAALKAENERLRDLLDSSYQLGNRVLIAELEAIDLDPFRQQILINKGSASGVYEGQSVINAHGVMGQVIHVSPFNASVLLITDPRHALPVQVLRNNLYTIAIGTGRIDQIELPYLTNNADIKIGDLLVTSGLGGKFPAGYPVAKITRIHREPSKPFATVFAEPLAQLDRIKEVLLVWDVKLPDLKPDAHYPLIPFLK